MYYGNTLEETRRLIMDDDGGKKKIVVADLVIDLYNPFAASPEELLTTALDEAGLLGPETTIDGQMARQYLESFFKKRAHYQETTKLGALLVRQGILSQEELRKSLTLQRQNSDMKLGEAMLELGICTVEDIEKSLDAQVSIRKDMEDLEQFRQRIDSIKARLREYF